jgi:uncharacterized membrane protein YeaQ/YmgE (transglycosylase-associated protein family)
MHFVLFVMIGLIAGALARQVVSDHDYGVAGDIAVAVIGAFLGGWISGAVLGVGGGGLLISLFLAFLGAIALLGLIRLIAPEQAS